MESKYKVVSIIQRRLTHYRVPLFQKLKNNLLNHNITLRVIHGHADRHDAKREDEGCLDWSFSIKNKSVRFGSLELLWQPVFKLLKDTNLLIIPPENSIISNYLLMLKKPLSKPLLAYWGHGRNFQNTAGKNIKERWRRVFNNLPDWWFAYTDLSYDYLTKNGYPSDKITILQNATDTTELKSYGDTVTDSSIKDVRNKLGIVGRNVAIFCGSIYKEKHIEVVLEASQRVREQLKDFELIIIGDGARGHVAKAAADRYKWIHYVGSRYGYDKVIYMKLGQIMLLPFVVGLAILDSFTLGIPIITMDNKSHSPEIAYLKNGINGIMTPNSIDDYVLSVVNTFNDPEKLLNLKKGCICDAGEYTIDNMANNFTNGILGCLGKVY